MKGLMDWAKALEIAIAASATLAAAYFGARAAFAFNLKHETDRERRRQVEECNRALFILLRQYNQLINFRAQFLDPVRTDPARHLLMPPSNHADYSGWSVNVPALAFLLQTEATELPFMLALADQRFHGAVTSMDLRSELHNKFQGALEKSNQGTAKWPLNRIHEVIGERLSSSLVQATDQLFELVDGAIANHEMVSKDATAVLRTLYKGSRFVGYTPDPDRHAAASPASPQEESRPKAA